MKAPAVPTRNPLAAHHLAVQGPGISTGQQNIRNQQSLLVADRLRAPAEAQDINRFNAQRLQELQEFNTQQLGVSQAIGGMQAGLAAAPRDGSLPKPGNPTAAAELMTAKQKEDLAQQMNARIREEIVAAAEQASGKPSQLRQLGERYGG
jgi:hypothetical protein